MLGLKFSRLVHTSLAGGALALTGCVDRAYDFGESGFEPDPSGDPDPSGNPDPTSPDPTDPTDPTGEPPPPPDVPGPPTLIAATMIDADLVALTFSEAIAPTDSVSPNQFRLSAAFAPQGKYDYTYGTFYQEIGRWNGEGYYCNEYCDKYCYEYEEEYCCWEYCYTPPGPPVRVSAITPHPDRQDILLLSLDNAIGGGVCAQLDVYPDPWITGLFVHYTTTGNALVTDNVGEPLAPIAEHWALKPDLEYVYLDGYFEMMMPVLPIPCTF